MSDYDRFARMGRGITVAVGGCVIFAVDVGLLVLMVQVPPPVLLYLILVPVLLGMAAAATVAFWLAGDNDWSER